MRKKIDALCNVTSKPTPIRGLGEIALRVKDLDTMQRFYTDVVGLELLRRFDDSAFFKIADGYAGHTQILALFEKKIPGEGFKRPWPPLIKMDESVRAKLEKFFGEVA